MATYPLTEAAQRAGVDVDELKRLVITPSEGDRFTSGAIRRVGMVRSLMAAGIPLDGLAAAIRGGQVSLDFLDEPAYERFSALSGVTFAELAERTGVPVQMLMLIPAGLHSRLEHPPAMCFLDITGYTRITEERGDAAAAGLAEQLGRLVQRASSSTAGGP